MEQTLAVDREVVTISHNTSQTPGPDAHEALNLTGLSFAVRTKWTIRPTVEALDVFSVRHRVRRPLRGIRRRGLRGAFDDGANLARATVPCDDVRRAANLWQCRRCPDRENVLATTPPPGVVRRRSRRSVCPEVPRRPAGSSSHVAQNERWKRCGPRRSESAAGSTR